MVKQVVNEVKYVSISAISVVAGNDHRDPPRAQPASQKPVRQERADFRHNTTKNQQAIDERGRKGWPKEHLLSDLRNESDVRDVKFARKEEET